VLATSCKILPIKINNTVQNINNVEKDEKLLSNNKINSLTHSFKTKTESQKLKIKNNWFDLFAVYGLDASTDSSSNDCEACCSKKKNTVFLPCKHSYSCSDCSPIVRNPWNKCPVCRQFIKDCLIINEIGVN
jgi:hypothetical protein